MRKICLYYYCSLFYFSVCLCVYIYIYVCVCVCVCVYIWYIHTHIYEMVLGRNIVLRTWLTCLRKHSKAVNKNSLLIRHLFTVFTSSHSCPIKRVSLIWISLIYIVAVWTFMDRDVYLEIGRFGKEVTFVSMSCCLAKCKWWNN